MIHIDHVAIAAVPARRRDDTVSGRNDGGAHIGGNVDPLMELRAVKAQPVGRADVARCRPDGGRRVGGTVRGIGGRTGELPAHGLGEEVNGRAARTETLLDHLKCLGEIRRGRRMLFTARRRDRSLLHGLVRRSGRCTDDGTQPVLGAAETVKILLECGCLFRHL